MWQEWKQEMLLLKWLGYWAHDVECFVFHEAWFVFSVRGKGFYGLQKHHDASLKRPLFFVKMLMVLLFCRSAEFCTVSPQHSSVLPNKHLTMWRTLFFPRQIVMCTPSVSPWKSKKMMEKEILGNQNGKGKEEMSLEKAHSFFARAQLLCCNKIHLTSFHKQTCYK